MGLPERFRTRRLLLSRFVAGDADDFARMRRDPRVAHMLGGARPDAETGQLAQDLAAHWDEHGFGWWALREPEGGRFIGCGGLRRVMVAASREIEVGFGLVPEYWGRGLATELARVAAAQGFVRLGTAGLVSFTLSGNTASRRVMEKTGFTYDRDIVHAGMPHVLYRLSAQGWRMAPVESRSSARAAAAEQAVAV